jgi:hypothetical protein
MSFSDLSNVSAPVSVATQQALELKGNSFLLHGEVAHGNIIGKTTGQYIDLVEIPANARVFRVMIGQKELWEGAGLTFDSKLVNGVSDTAYDRSGYSTANFVSYLTIVGNIMGNVLTWKKESVATTLKLKFTSDVVDVEIGDVLEYWVEYVQEAS